MITKPIKKEYIYLDWNIFQNMKHSYKRNIMLQQPLLLKILNIN